jgi:cobalt/nickel transport system permease protein
MLYSPAPMHIPDGFLSVILSLALWALSAGAVALALRQANRQLDERTVPLMGILAAAIFAGQMINFTVAGGTSGHLMGAALATILVGPWASILVMTAVVSVQALLFQDGGLLALGANIFNMAVVGTVVSYTVYAIVRRIAGEGSRATIASGFAAAWVSILATALTVALQLAVSGTSPANLAIPAMGGVHAIIGIGEGLITAGALAFISASRPGLLTGKEKPLENRGLVLFSGAVVTLLLALLSPLASANPDGLEWVAEQQGFAHQAQGALYQLLPDYVIPGISNQALATIAAGILGAVIVFGVTSVVSGPNRTTTRQKTASQ